MWGERQRRGRLLLGDDDAQPSRQHGDAVTIIILGEMGMMYAFVFPSECPVAAICVLTN